MLPARAWCLVLVNRATLTAIEADAEIDRLPVLELDRTLADLTLAQRQALAARLGQLGVDTAGMDATTTVRQVLRRIAGTLLADADPEGLDVGNEGP